MLLQLLNKALLHAQATLWQVMRQLWSRTKGRGRLNH